MKKWILFTACLILASCAVLSPKTSEEKAQALKWCVGAEWVIGVTDIMADMACNSGESKWSETGCMAYDLTSSLLKSQLEGVRLVAEVSDDPVKIDGMLRDAQGTYHKVDAVYKGAEIQTDNPVTPFQSFFSTQLRRTTMARNSNAGRNMGSNAMASERPHENLEVVAWT